MNRKVLEILIAVTILIIAAFLCVHFRNNAGKQNEVYINYENSFFSDFYIKGDTVYFVCRVEVVNNCNTEKKVGFSATLQRDYENGLLKSPILETDLIDGKEKTVFIPANSTKKVYVTFIGQHGENDIKSDRLLPEVMLIEME